MRLIDADKARETATVDLIVHHLDRQPTVHSLPGDDCLKARCIHIDPKDRELKDVHKNLLNKICKVHTVYIDLPAFFDYEAEDGVHRIRTSNVCTVSRLDDNLYISTNNTDYTFQQVFD